MKWTTINASSIRESNENNVRKRLLGECVIAYSPFTKQQEEEFEALLVSEPYSGVTAMRKTWYEQGEEHGIQLGEERGIQLGEEHGIQLGEERGRRIQLREQLETRFGKLKKTVLKKHENCPRERLPDLGKALLTAQSLKDLGLDK